MNQQKILKTTVHSLSQHSILFLVTWIFIYIVLELTAVRYSWLKNGVPLEDDDRLKVNGNVVLMNNPTENAEGYYQCIARNVAGAAMSNITFVQAAGHHLVILKTCNAFKHTEMRCYNAIHELLAKLLVIPCE